MKPHRPRLLSRVVALLVALALVARPGTAQDVRELTVPTAHLALAGVTASYINTQVSAGYRLTDIKYRGYNLLGSVVFDVTMVRNSGSYASGWWWYYGLTGSQVTSYVNSNNARLIDLDPYEDPSGNLRFACVMVSNTGSNQKSWWWYYNASVSFLSSQATANNARLVDVDSYTYNGTTYYSAVMIRNTGADARSWWWYVNATGSQVSSYLSSNNARLYNLDYRDGGRFNCIMIRDTSPKAWYWWYGLRTADIVYLLNNYGVRALTLQSYLVGSTRYYAMLTINNSNALTTDVGNRMRATTNGQVGCWLEQVNGANFADLNGSTSFEPASTMKTLHHVHAMRRVRLGAVSLTTPINVFTNYSSTNSSCPIDTGPVSQQLQSVLRLMMENSDNARTQAVTAYFGENNINATAAALGMTGTSLNHRLGCGAEALANPNQIRLRDLHALHENVANGYLGSYRDTFYDLMLESLSGLAIDALINTEGAALSLPSQTIASFRNFTRLAHKGGNYTLINGGTIIHRAEFGWISLPFISNDMIVPREYTFGAFVNDASNDTNARNAIYQQAIPELLRSTIRAALSSWTNSLAGIQAIGAGCGSPVYQQTVNNVPRIGNAVSYRGNNGYASSLALLGIGFSSSVWNGTSLPALMTPFGGEPGCRAYNDIAVSIATVANSTGYSSHSVSIPNSTSVVGSEYLTQWYSFNGSSFRTSNGYRTIVGL
ncbi:MAG: serine hydrolase [Planctomycetes bacterium]|nr:serine hydrolase [Planctomycetota bacterium]